MIKHLTAAVAVPLSVALTMVIVPPAHAEEPMTVESPTTMWSATTHLGFAVVDQSSTGFRNVGGSLVFLDVSRQVTPTFDVGLRTTGEGGHAQPGNQFYRLATGPLATWNVDDSWRLSMALSRFDETALDAAGSGQYRSTGAEAQLGWERAWQVTSRIETALGGFVAAHRGSYERIGEKGGSPAAAGGVAAAAIQLNSGLAHGLEAALRVKL